MPHQHTIRLTLPTTTAPLHPLTPRLKSPAFLLPASPHELHYQQSPCLSPSRRFQAPQPPSPLAWTWRCHLCYTTYRLGTTRRCLLDGHYFCSNPPPPPAPTPSPSPSPSPQTHSDTSPTGLIAPPPLAERRAYVPCGSEEVLMKAKERKEKRGRKCKKKAHESCTSSFDYMGWADWNAWRRKLSPVIVRAEGLRSAAMSCGEKHQKDCFWDCDFPSECSWQRTSAYLESVMEESPVLPF
jgi:hypothetical protein